MRPLGLGLIAALVVAVTGVGMLSPATVMSATKPATPAVSPEQRKQGMAEAPAAIAAAGVPCQLSDARFVGKVPEDKKAGKGATSYYEVACGTGAMGYVISTTVGGAPTSFTCIEADTTQAGGKAPALPCILPGNADPKAALVAPLKAAGVDCTPTAARAFGQNKTQVFMEVACQQNTGYLVIAPNPFDGSKRVTTQNCLAYDDADSNVKCTLSSKASRLAVVDTLNAAAKTGCVIKDRRFVGEVQDGSVFYETACQDGKGYMLKASAAGAFTEAYECSKAQALLGGCTLTDARQAATEQAALYTRLAKAAGSNCEVDHYAVFPARGADDVVELYCKDGSADVGIFRAGGAKGTVLDCGHALLEGYKCGAAEMPAAYKSLTADLKKFDRNSCDVSDARSAGKSDKGTSFIEVACADGLKGYMIEYKTDPLVAVSANGCAIAGGCSLPGNKK